MLGARAEYEATDAALDVGDVELAVGAHPVDNRTLGLGVVDREDGLDIWTERARAVLRVVEKRLHVAAVEVRLHHEAEVARA